MTDLHPLLKELKEAIDLYGFAIVERWQEIDRRLKRLDEIKEICLFDPVAKYEDWVYEYIKEFLEDD